MPFSTVSLRVLFFCFCFFFACGVCVTVLVCKVQTINASDFLQLPHDALAAHKLTHPTTSPPSSVTTSLFLSLCLSFSPAFDHITHSTSLSPVIVPLLSCRCLSNACSIFPPHPLQFSLPLSFFCQLVSVTITFHISVLFPCSSVSPVPPSFSLSLSCCSAIAF